MDQNNLKQWHHNHTFGQDQRKPGEWRTLLVIVITLLMMVLEIVAGIRFGSMALLADGLHMGSHAVALSITAFAYIYARRQANNERFSFGTGKVNALGGFTGAMMLAMFALFMVVESVDRLINPLDISFNQSIIVATVGLVINGICAVILSGGNHAHHHHHHHHHHDEHHHPHNHHEDHNLTSAYLHVLADALTSILAIVALLFGKYWGWSWMDPIMGVIGAILVARWSVSLLKSTSKVLLDHQAPSDIRQSITQIIEKEGDVKVTDLHVWSIGPGFYSAQLSIVGSNPSSPSSYKSIIPDSLGLVHVNIEVNVLTAPS